LEYALDENRAEKEGAIAAEGKDVETSAQKDSASERAGVWGKKEEKGLERRVRLDGGDERFNQTYFSKEGSGRRLSVEKKEGGMRSRTKLS